MGPHFKATAVKFSMMLRTWDTLPAPNFVKITQKIAQGACRYCIAPWTWCKLISSILFWCFIFSRHRNCHWFHWSVRYITQPLCCCNSFAVENNVPFITVSGKGSITRQWTVLEQNSVTFSTSDPDNDTVKMDGWQPLPSSSSLSQVPNSDMWEFVWTPVNMDPVELVWVKRQQIQTSSSFCRCR